MSEIFKAKKTYKFKLYPLAKQVEKLNSWLALSCELYNAGLQERRDAWRFNKVSISFYDQNKQLTEIKHIRTEPNEMNSHVLQDLLQRLDKSFKGFFSRVKKGIKAGYSALSSGLKLFPISDIQFVPLLLIFRIVGNILF